MRISPSQEADYPEKLENAFRDRRFSELDPPELLYIEGAEFILVAASENIHKELGQEIETKSETENSADIFKDLKIDKNQSPIKPLFKGDWE